MSTTTDRKKVQIYLSEAAGFCQGVRRAIKLVRETALAEGRTLAYGELIHNRRVMHELEELGVHVIEDPACVDAVVVTRAHGITSRERQALEASGQRIIDGTCLLVTRIKESIDSALASGALVVILGHAQHPEVVGLVDGRDEIIVVGSPLDLDEPQLGAAIKSAGRVALFSQSTQRLDLFEAVGCRLAALNSRIELHDTICTPTKTRQAGAVELARKVEIMIVVGDMHSSNSRRLAETAAEKVHTEMVSGAADLRPEWFAGLTRIGVTAGASVPDTAIQEVLNSLCLMLDGEIVHSGTE